MDNLSLMSQTKTRVLVQESVGVVEVHVYLCRWGELAEKSQILFIIIINALSDYSIKTKDP